MGGIKRPPTEGLSLPHYIWLRLDHQFCFHGFWWFLYNTSSCNRWADCHSSLQASQCVFVFCGFTPVGPVGFGWRSSPHVWTSPWLNAVVSSKPPSYARSKPWRGATRSKKYPVTIAQKCDSCERNHKVLFVSVCVESSLNVGQTFFEPYPLAIGTITETTPSLLTSLEADARTAARSMVGLFCTKLQIAPFGSYLPGWIANIASVCARVFHLSA